MPTTTAIAPLTLLDFAVVHARGQGWMDGPYRVRSVEACEVAQQLAAAGYVTLTDTDDGGYVVTPTAAGFAARDARIDDTAHT